MCPTRLPKSFGPFNPLMFGKIFSLGIHCLDYVIEKLKNMSSNIEHVSLTINWRYDEDDEDILDSGKEFEKMTGVKMEYIPNS